MNGRTLIVVTLAVVCGLSAMILVQAIRRPPSAPPVETVPVIFIATEVKPGETIQASMLEIRDIPKTDVPEDAIHKMPDALERAALTQLDKGDLLRERKLAEKGAGRGMAALIKPGMRAFTIQTPTFSSSLAGFLLPGNRVDVLMTANVSNTADDDAGASTTTLLQNVEILAVHTTVNLPTSNKIDPDQARSITLLVTPEEASLLDLGQNKGTLHLSLRNLMDTDNKKPKPTTLADLQLPRLKVRPPVEPPPPAPTPPPAPPPAPAFVPPPIEPEPEPEPEEEEVQVIVRTLRGTSIGSDVWTVLQPPKPTKSKSKAKPKSKLNPDFEPTPPTTGTARTASAGAPRGGRSAIGAGSPP